MSERDLVHHYKVLKQFLAISDDQQSRAKSSSSRAQRAREKLLKLSSAQFKELSTDVYDELRRRIDESRTEPDYLLPKLLFIQREIKQDKNWHHYLKQDLKI